MSDLNVSEQQDVRKAIERPEVVLLVRLRTTDKFNNNNDDNDNNELAVANVHVTWSLLKYPALQALQVSLCVMASLRSPGRK